MYLCSSQWTSSTSPSRINEGNSDAYILPSHVGRSESENHLFSQKYGSSSNQMANLHGSSGSGGGGAATANLSIKAFSSSGLASVQQLPEFPSYYDFRPYLDANITEDRFQSLLTMYRAHSQRIMDSINKFSFIEAIWLNIAQWITLPLSWGCKKCLLFVFILMRRKEGKVVYCVIWKWHKFWNFILFQIPSLFKHFWQEIPNHILCFIGQKSIVTFIGVCDQILYTTILKAILPSPIQVCEACLLIFFCNLSSYRCCLRTSWKLCENSLMTWSPVCNSHLKGCQITCYKSKWDVINE